MIDTHQLVVVDIEATCWEGGKPPPGQQNEIIEIGVCTLSLVDGTISSPRSLFVRPTRSEVSQFCTELTTLTAEQLSVGMTFEDACAALRADFDTLRRPWASWGSYDRRMFEEQCAGFGVEYPFSEKHVNLKQRFGKLYRIKSAPGMTAALDYLKLPLLGTHHRGGDDAYNIARIGAATLAAHGREALLGKSEKG
jgi:inhibitor of KinA sporulation pathway (predicted exonuclease)